MAEGNEESGLFSRTAGSGPKFVLNPPDPAHSRRYQEALARRRALSPLQLALVDAVETLKMAVSMRANVKGGPSVDFLERLKAALVDPDAEREFLCKEGNEMQSIRMAIALLKTAAPNSISEVQTYVESRLN